MALSDKIVGVESGGDANAKNPNSSAQGAGQFIDSTWLATMQAHRPDLTQGKSTAEILAMRSDPRLSAEMTDAYASDNQAVLRKAGVPVTDGTTYLAHFAGPQGAIKILQADPGASAESVLGSAAVKANPFLANMTAQDVQAWAARKMGTQSPAPGVRTSPTTTAGQQPIFAGAQEPKAPAQSSRPEPAAAGYSAPIFAAAPAPQAPIAAASPGPNQVNMAPLQQQIARLRNSSPIFAGVPNLLKMQGA